MAEIAAAAVVAEHVAAGHVVVAVVAATVVAAAVSDVVSDFVSLSPSDLRACQSEHRLLALLTYRTWHLGRSPPCRWAKTLCRL